MDKNGRNKNYNKIEYCLGNGLELLSAPTVLAVCQETRRKEHQRNFKNYTRGSNIANHAWQNNHSIDFDGATVIDKGNYRIRRTLESWHTAKTVGADNNSKPLPRQYSILL